MILIIGGKAQGKRDYLLSLGYSDLQIADGEHCPIDVCPDEETLDKLHLVVRRLLEAGKDPVRWVEQYCMEHPHWIITADEVGAGIVPMDPAEREWREQCGRICCRLAAQADRVVRLYAGIPTLIKGK